MKDFELLIYNTPTEDVMVNVVLKDETIWATQKGDGNLIRGTGCCYQQTYQAFF